MNNSRPTQPQPHQPPAGMTVGDIYYVVFRHKWKIILLSLAGFAAAAAFYLLKPPLYLSQAELLIQYVPQTGVMPLMGADQQVVVPGDDIINSEIQILTSLDVAEQAATNIGPASILAMSGGGSNNIAAASLIRNNLKAEPAGARSSVILVTFTHPDFRIVQPVLQEVINDYFEKHKEIHSAGGQYDEALSREQSTLNAALNDTERQLADLKNQAGIISLDDARKGLADQISKIKGAMSDAQAELAGFGAVIKDEGGTPSVKLETTNAPTAVPPDQIDAYNDICASLDTLRKKEQNYILIQGFTKSNSLVMGVDGQIASTQKAKSDLETKYPQIAALGTVSPAPGESSASPAADSRAQRLDQVTALRAELLAWETNLDDLQMQATNLNSLEPIIAHWEQVKAIQQANLQILSEGLEKTHIQDAIDAGKAPNIKWVQMPSPPSRDWKKTDRTVAMLAFGGVFAGLALAFLIELVLDRSLRRPVEIEAKLKVPLFLSIPDVNRNGHSRLAEIAGRRQLQLADAAKAKDSSPAGGNDPASSPNTALQVVSLERNSALYPFCESLRDRLIVYFEVKNLTHKPKMVAVTSAGKGAGVSSIAAGLAASLSETGEGNVLLVDMNLEQGAAQQFYKGKPGCGLDTALQSENKQNALVQENLYVVNGNARSVELPGVLPKRFAALVPRLKASDYDYIIFDMPPVSQTSLTSRLSRFMDMTLLVIESEKTGREVVQQANTWLAESGATVGAVLNKTRQYVPERLHQEFLSDK